MSLQARLQDQALTRRTGRRALLVAATAWAAAIGLRAQVADLRVPAEAAALVVDGGGQSRLEARADVLDTPVLPGSIAKVFATEAAYRACHRAVQIHGGYGYIREYPVERHLRDVKVTSIYEGTSEIQRVIIARDLLREGCR